MATLSPELRQAIRDAGPGPVRLEDPETHETYVLISAEQFETLRALLGDEPVESLYPALDEAFRAAWDDPQMSDYDDYEANRP